MDQQNNRPTTPEEQDAAFQRQEAIRLANEGSAGEATPPDLGPDTNRHGGSPSSDENFDGRRGSTVSGKSLEDRDTNDGDANNENS